MHASQLENEIARAQAAEAAMLVLESLRETAARLYLNETGHSWRPAGGSRANHGTALTSAVVARHQSEACRPRCCGHLGAA